MKKRALIFLVLIGLFLLTKSPISSQGQISSIWLNPCVHQTALGKGQYTTRAYIGPRVFYNNDTKSWQDLLLENYTGATNPHYLVRNAHITAKIGLYEGQDAVLYYDPEYTQKVCAERWNVQAYILGSWVKLNKTFWGHSVFQNDTFINVTGIFRTWYKTTAVGWLRISYLLKPAAYLKHDVTYKSTYAGSFDYRAVMTLVGIAGKRILHNKGSLLLNSTEVQGVWNRLSFRNSTNPYFNFLNEKLDSLGHYETVNGSEIWINDYLKAVRLKMVQYWGKDLARMDIVIGNYTLGQNQIFRIDPDTSTWSVGSDADDRNVYEGESAHPPWNTMQAVGANALRAGRWSSELWGGFMRWTGLNIASGSTIDEAKFGKYCYDARSGDSDTRIWAVEDSGSPAAPTDVGEYNAQDYTEAYIDWDYDWTIDGAWYTSPEVKTIVQEVVDQFTLTTFIILHEDRAGGSTSQDDLANQYYRDTGLTANLTITWSTVEEEKTFTPTSWANMSSQAIPGIEKAFSLISWANLTALHDWGKEKIFALSDQLQTSGTASYLLEKVFSVPGPAQASSSASYLLEKLFTLGQYANESALLDWAKETIFQAKTFAALSTAAAESQAIYQLEKLFTLGQYVNVTAISDWAKETIFQAKTFAALSTAAAESQAIYYLEKLFTVSDTAQVLSEISYSIEKGFKIFIVTALASVSSSMHSILPALPEEYATEDYVIMMMMVAVCLCIPLIIALNIALKQKPGTDD